VLGIGNRNVVPVPVDAGQRLDITTLEGTIRAFKRDEPETRILAVVGIAGTTETGTIDPLDAMADICRREGIHFHVDAAWGGPTLLSEAHRHLLTGIERADSVTIDGHKQFYMPMSCGMVYFKDPTAMDAVAYHARYINRPGSVDLGIRSLVGSRAATSLVLGSALDIMGSRGYALLIDHGIRLAGEFADEIMNRPLFQLVTPPCLNILTYRILPKDLQGDTEAVNGINKRVQRLQREAGRSFVSRTTLSLQESGDTVVLRAVLMNPFTTIGILRDILDEQESLYRREVAGRP
jgi:glutamate decarboxylase